MATQRISSGLSISETDLRALQQDGQHTSDLGQVVDVHLLRIEHKGFPSVAAQILGKTAGQLLRGARLRTEEDKDLRTDVTSILGINVARICSVNKRLD